MNIILRLPLNCFKNRNAAASRGRTPFVGAALRYFNLFFFITYHTDLDDFFPFCFCSIIMVPTYYVIKRVHWSRNLFQRNKTERVLNTTLNICFVPTWTLDDKHTHTHIYIHTCNIKFVDSRNNNTCCSVWKPMYAVRQKWCILNIVMTQTSRVVPT